MTAGGEHHGDHFFGHAVGVGAGGVHNINLFLAGIFGVNGVKTGTGTHHEFQVGQSVDFRGGDLFAADDQHFGITVGGDQVGDRGVGILHNVVILGGKQLGSNFVQFSRYQNLLHFNNPVFKCWKK